MAYERVNWENLPSTKTPVNATNLNKLNDAIDQAGAEIFVGAEEPTTGGKVWFRKGKNLFNKNVSIITGYYLDNEGSLVSNEASWYQNVFIEVNSKTQYTISSTAATLRICFYDKDRKFISREGTANTSVTFSTPENCKYVRLSGDSADTQVQSLQLEQGSKATSYEAYIEPQIFVKNSNGVYEEFATKANSADVYTKNDFKNAGAHNSLYRGKDITSLFYNGILSQQIAVGTFDDIFVGDYIIGKVSGRKYLVADLNYRLHTGDTECTKNHVLMIPERIMGTALMNDSHVTTGGYVGSKMYTTNLAQFKTVIQNDFGSGHILNHGEILTNAVTDGKSSGWGWYDSTIELMNESMVYGHNVWGSHHGYETGIDKSQLSLFKHKPDLIVTLNDAGSRHWYWLRDVVSSSNFAIVGSSGHANTFNAGYSGGVRPAFLIY